MHGVVTCLLAGCTLFSTGKYDPDESWHVIRRERITVYHGSALPLIEMSARMGPELKLGSSLDRCWFVATAAENARLEHDWGARMCGIFGLTETGGCSSLCSAEDPLSLRHTSAGRPLPGIEIKIVARDSNNNVMEGQPGEIRVGGWNLMRGYFRDLPATESALGQDGRLRTGDEGVLTGGFLTYRLRYKDIIRGGGENVVPSEIEDVIAGYPGVAEVDVVAAADDRLTEVPVAFVVAQPGSNLDAAALVQHCRRALASFKVPRQVIITSELPRTDGLRKVQKAKLRELLADGSDDRRALLGPPEVR
jgi:acyl-CoA synthetase (AMP-forming)/AMP-acid ligase II